MDDTLTIIAYILAMPFLLVWGIERAVRYCCLLVCSVSSAVICRGCGQEVALLGIWQCQCGFTYRGHLLRPCPVCNCVPKAARCLHCRATTLLIER
jgi:hypothetical protein